MIYRIVLSSQLVEHVFGDGTRTPALTVKGGIPSGARLVDVEMEHHDSSIVLLFEKDDDSGEVETLYPTYIAERT